ncbi:MAG TPA: M13 family metallopeptidase [Gemmatimonadaceae bacterium]|nr:M13 family metallopeptidase [Gemmatimonadaceae bacterium]
MRLVHRALALTFALATSAAAQTSAVPMQTKPLDPANLDRSVSACTDFYQFANGGWIKSHPIPAAYSSWGSFNELQENNQSNLTTILRAAAANGNPQANADLKKLAVYYSTCMDSAAAERAGAQPIQPELSRIAALTNRSQVEGEIARLQSMGIGAVFGFGAQQDAKNSTAVIAGVSQGGLSLPDRDYYLNPAQRYADIRSKYQDHVAKMFELAGESAAQAATDAQRVVSVETALARPAKTRVELRDPNGNYHKMTAAELAQAAPGFNWPSFFAGEGRSDISTINVQNPVFLKAVDSLLTSAPVDDWKAYLRWHVIDAAAPELSSAFVNEDFRFGSTLSGAKELLPRDKRCTRATDAGLRDALGQAYVAQYFTPQAKQRALEMVRNLESVFHDRIETLGWMSDTTKAMAETKLAAFTNKIGYPDKWRDYSTLNIQQGPFINNVLAVRQYERRRNIARIGRPVDRTEWGMTPSTVNAYYNPLMNEIVFPAGIMQPPFFDPKADDAVNYGGMGAVIGHEMTHGFDDQGAQFDAQGNLKNWWSSADLEKFKHGTGLVASQYDAYTVLDSLHVNGKLTLGENLADLGGLSIAYAALEKALAQKGRPANIDGFTPEQRFFLAWAQIWRGNMTPEATRLRINTDPHSPGEWRTNGPLSNLPQFAAAFGCKAGDPMVRPDSVRPVIW